MTASAGGSVASRNHARTHVINASGISLASLLCFPNDRASNLSGNGVGYIKQIDSEYQNTDFNSRSAKHSNIMARLSLTSDL